MDEKYKFLKTSFGLDRKLYKYYSNVNHAIDSIKNRQIHLDSPQTFNDPFDCLFCVSYFTSKSNIDTTESVVNEIRQYIIKVASTTQNTHYTEIVTALTDYLMRREFDYSKKAISDTVREMYHNFGNVAFSFEDFCDVIDSGYESEDGLKKLKVKVSCFSEINNSVLMWSYYANSHNGICVEYDLSKLDMYNDLNQRIVDNLAKVHYSPIRADSLFDLSNDNNIFNFVVSKSDAWSHENEWRIICDTEEEFLPFDCVSCVYLGVNFDTKAPRYKRLLDAVKKYDNLSIKKCVLNSSDFNISFQELYSSKWKYYLDELSNKKGESNYDLQKK